MSITFKDEILGLWLLNSLPDTWETFRVPIINSAPSGVVSLESIKSSTLNEEMRRKAQGSSQPEVLLHEDRGRNFHRNQKGRDKSKSKSKSRYKDVECHYCHKMGHIKRNCFK